MLENPIQIGPYPIPDRDTASVRSPDMVSIFGARITNLTYEQGLQAIQRLFETRAAALAGDPIGARGATLFFCNANTLSFVQSDPDYLATLNSADLLFGDGTGVRLAAAMRGVLMKANLNGTDLVPDILRWSEGRGARVFLLGGEEDANLRAAEYLAAEYPRITIVGRSHGYLTEADGPRLVAEINGARTDLLLVGMGHPRQEQWIDAYAAELKVPLTMAVGGLFAYWGNGLKRASKLSRQLGFEWLEIMVQQPHKMRRYLLGGPKYLFEAALTVPADLRRMRTPAGR